MAAEEDIDNETLQAQIDLSLSFAQNLVSSWVKPSLKPTKSSSRSFDAELKEYMRRPPRLGVGAAIPETSVSSRDTEKLKSHLKKGGKRVREDEDDAAKQLSDNEIESRGASVKKKARIDPFESNKKKKKKGIEGDAAPAVVPPPPPEPVTSVEEEKPSSPTFKRRKKKKNKDAPESSQDSASLPGPSTAPPESPVEISTVNSVEVPNSQTRPSYVISSSPSASPSAQRLKLQSALLKGPILNLTGPPADDEEESGGEGSPEASKKKRRKRKKKKSAMGAQQEPPV